MRRIIYCFWTGSNIMSEQRKECLDKLRAVSGCEVLLISKDNLFNYIVKDNPLHPAYEYLSETHKADYLRAYFMNFHGGGYSDIKQTTGPWIQMFEDLMKSTSWICGYKEIQGGEAHDMLHGAYNELVGNCAYICKGQTPITRAWYDEILSVLDEKLEELKAHPSTFPQDRSELNTGYPIGWNEICGRIFHKICYRYKFKVLNTLPPPIFQGYR